MALQDDIQAFLAGDRFAVVGASNDRSKYGNKVLRVYLQAGRTAYPINPKEPQVEGLSCYPDLASLPEPVHGVSIITPPAVTNQILQQAAAAGIRYVWMQPGAESPDWAERAQELGLVAIGGGPCILVTLRYHE